MGRLNERVAIVTGGARGIGTAVARLFATEGAAVTVADVLDIEGEKLAAELGGPARYAHLDVSAENDWQTVLAERSIGEPEEVARMVLFIAADATYSTGTEFILDGGVTAGPPTALTPEN